MSTCNFGGLGMETWLIGLKGVCFGIAFRNKAHKDHCDLHNLTTNVMWSRISLLPSCWVQPDHRDIRKTVNWSWAYTLASV
ncbi:unnamed protein product [Urochloa humidicola]